ncbi:MAG: hypothetical protein EP332_01675 [Bacteroidetes bacterium]|nr:MAG: hypothetical protein EP332_01675 [Bacteroidota bacterium]
MIRSISVLLASFISLLAMAQSQIPFSLSLTDKTVSGINGIHSFAFGQHGSYVVFVGGRTDGIHPRQPFAAFQTAGNNQKIILWNTQTDQVIETSVTVLPQDLQEHLQSTNMNFHQNGDTLYIAGGYAYSPSSLDHKTFPFLCTIELGRLTDSMLAGGDISAAIQQIQDPYFAVTGGHLSYLGDDFYLVGGHQFDGRYNPMGNATYTQTYTDAVRVFKVQVNGGLQVSDKRSMSDANHLHRRDYNLMTYAKDNSNVGLMISSGVFQAQQDLPFLYPVFIDSMSYTPRTSFNQYLSHYHSASATLYDAAKDDNYMVFFGGLSQYYYDGAQLIKDDQVPFVKTISIVKLDALDSLEELALPTSMADFSGASAEFVPLMNLANIHNEVLLLDSMQGDSILIGYIVGGIRSTSLNPFSNNTIANTSADNRIKAVYVHPNQTTGVQKMSTPNPIEMQISPNPARHRMRIHLNQQPMHHLRYKISTLDGRVVSEFYSDTKMDQYEIILQPEAQQQILLLQVEIDGQYRYSRPFVQQSR